jgi:hypothetical protein
MTQDYEFVEDPSSQTGQLTDYEFVPEARPVEGPPMPAWMSAKNTTEDVAKTMGSKALQATAGVIGGGIGSAERFALQDIPTLARNAYYQVGKAADIYSPAEAAKAQAAPLYSGQTEEQQKGSASPIDPNLPTYSGVQEYLKKEYPGIIYEPKTLPAKLAGAAVEQGIMSAPGKFSTLPERMVTGATSGVGAEAGKEYAEAYNASQPFWSIAGALAGGGAGALAGPRAINIAAPDRAARNAMEASFTKAVQNGETPLTSDQFKAAMDSGTPLSVYHLLDPATQELVAKYAGMTPQAKNVVTKFNKNLEGIQANGNERISNFLKDIHGGNELSAPDLTNAQAAIGKAERDQVFGIARANPNADAIPTKLFSSTQQNPSNLLDHPAVQQAMKNASDDAEVLTKYNIIPPKTIPGQEGKIFQTPTGFKEFPATPEINQPGNLSYWQLVKENLDSQIEVASRQGDNRLVDTLTTIKDDMKKRLGSVVPEYETALKKASESYMSQNAPQAGYIFAKSPDQYKISDIRNLKNGYNPEQTELFGNGVAARINDIAQTPNGVRTLASKFGSDFDFQKRMQEAMGPDRFNAVKGKIMSEDYLRNAEAMGRIEGSGASYLPVAGTAGVVGAVGGALGEMALSNPEAMSALATASGAAGGAAAAAALGAVGTKVLSIEQQRIANRILPLAASQDSKDLARFGEIMSKNSQARGVMDKLSDAVMKYTGANLAASIGGSPTARSVMTQIPARFAGGRVGRASGGKVSGDVQHLVDRLMNLAEQAKRSTDNHTKPLLDAPDASIVKALRVANEAI